MPLPARAAESLDSPEIVRLARELVRIPSHPGIHRQEEAVVDALEAWLGERGLSCRRTDVRPGRPNLLCTLEAPRPGRHLILCGHTDTVPLNADDPGSGFSGEERDGRIHGRGSVDMKGAVAAMAGVLAALSREDLLEKGKVTLAAVMNEEMEGWGVEHLVAEGIEADGALVGEPTENVPCLGHKGLEWLEVELVGRAAHGGTPSRGVNAIAAAARFVSLVETELLPRFPGRTHELLGPPTLNFGTIRGGDQPSTVAARCVLSLDRRSVPGETYETVTAELAEILRRVEDERPGIRAEIRRFPGGFGELERNAFATQPDHPLALAVASACESERGAPPTFGAFPAWTDGGMLAGPAGIPTVVLGPGDLSLAHSPREALPVDALLEAARIYLATALDFCHGSGS